MLNGLKCFVWSLKWWDKNCPLCGKVLVEHGFQPRFDCECGFGKKSD
jgi:ribosomal protein S27AE